MPTRRAFLRQTAVYSAGLALAPATRAASATSGHLIEKIDGEVIFPGRIKGPSWFHPRPTLLPSADGPRILMTLQLISGSDVYGPVHWTRSDDAGATWAKPEPIAGLGRVSLGSGWERGVCDVVPQYHRQTDSVLAIGHDVFYEDNVLARPQRPRRPVYVVRSNDGTWSSPLHLEWDHPDTSRIYSCGCSQRVNLPDGDVLIPLTFGPRKRLYRSVTSVRCGFDGGRLTVKSTGTVLKNDVRRGLLEPSLTSYNGKFYMTIRAEDERGYVTTSSDGLSWTAQQPWCWDDGTPLTMSTTQQHWLPHSDGLFLVYTRKTPVNAKVMRFRAPLFIAQVDPKRLCLIRGSEQVVLPIVDDPENPRHVARMGNFHTLNVSPNESWVTVGEGRPAGGYHGNTLLARIRWATPNGLVSEA